MLNNKNYARLSLLGLLIVSPHFASAIDCSPSVIAIIKKSYPATLSCSLKNEIDGDENTWGGEYECFFRTPVGGVRERDFLVFHKAHTCDIEEIR